MGKQADDTIIVVSGVPVLIGETIAVVIQGDGPNGIFVGRVAAIDSATIRLVLTLATGTIPAGAIVAIRRANIAAIARRPSNTTF